MNSEAGDQVPNAEAKIAEVKTKIKAAEARITSVKTEIAEAHTAIEKPEIALNNSEIAEERKIELKEAVARLDSRLALIQNSLTSLQTLEAALHNLLVTLNSRLNTILLANASIANAVDGSESSDLYSGLQYIRNAVHPLSYKGNSPLDYPSSVLELADINDFTATWEAIAFCDDDFDDYGAMKEEMRSRVQQALENAKGDSSFHDGYCLVSIDLLMGSSVRNLTEMGESFLRQFIYSSFSCLLVAACFDPSENYKAGEIVRSSLLFRSICHDTTEKRSSAAQSVVQIDQEKSIALLCSTLILLKIQKISSAKLRLPMILGHGHYAYLFVVYFADESREAIPKVSRVKFNFNLEKNEERTELFVALFLLLRDVKKILSGDDEKEKKKMKRKMDEYKGSCHLNQQTLTNAPKAIPSKSQTRSSKRQKTGGSNHEKEELACQAAQCGGLFHGIDNPWPKRISFDEDFSSDYQEESPYYFIGRSSNGEKCFLKIWREDDDGFHDAREEVRFLKLDQNHNVAVARLITDDIVPVSVRGIQFEVLATEYIESSLVSSVDHLLHFSVSLMKVVRALHDKAGVLHCDIKPNNLRWLSSRQQVYLIDFGHAQLVKGAKHYNATKAFEAPEIRNDKLPHSCETDAYSVGATILWVWDDYTRLMGLTDGGMDDTVKKLRFVGESLSAPQTDRMSLDHAIRVLETLEEQYQMAQVSTR
ncbi:MAG: hypothetical protein SGBAC_005719 [Bacillariaceae sp.]